MMDHEQFVEELRQALEDLHDPDRLGQSPLIVRCGLAGQKSPYDALQRLLTDAIAGLEPGPDVPASSRAWRIYDLLACRYIQELSVPAVAHQLGMSVRHLRREQNAAIEALAYRLQEQVAASSASPDRTAATRDRPVEDPLLADLGWLRTTPVGQPTDLAAALMAAIELTRPLAAKYASVVDASPADPLPGLAVHPVALDQILLNLLTVAIRRAVGGEVRVTVTSGRWAVTMELHARPHPPAVPVPSPDDPASLTLAQELAGLCGGRLNIKDGRTELAAVAWFPTFERIPVLVVDDNLDTLRLLEHYATGSRYRILGTADPVQAVSLAQAVTPQVVIVDVMMPAVDGWRLLGQLREHPATAHVPILVCTILAQEELARSLGAAGFLRKPLTQEAFLAALDREAVHLAPGSPSLLE